MAEYVPADLLSPHAVAPPGPGGAHRSSHESCWLCGKSQTTYQLVADGGDACADVRWYCEDARACTERWTARRNAGAGV